MKYIITLITLFITCSTFAQEVKQNNKSFGVVSSSTVTISIEGEKDALKVIFSQITAAKVKKGSFDCQWGPNLYWKIEHLQDKDYKLTVNNTTYVGTLGKLKSMLRGFLLKEVKFEE